MDLPGQSYLHGFSQCMVSLWLLTSSFKEDAASSQFLQETPGRGPSPAQTTACNSRSLVGLAAEPVWQKQPDFPFNSCLAFQRDGQEKSAVSVLKKKKKAFLPRLPPLLIPPALHLLSLLFRSQSCFLQIKTPHNFQSAQGDHSQQALNATSLPIQQQAPLGG